MTRRNALGLLATIGFVLTSWTTSPAQYGGRAGYGAASGYGYSFLIPDTAESRSTSGYIGMVPIAQTAYTSVMPQLSYTPYYTSQPLSYAPGSGLVATRCGVWMNAPGALAYRVFGFPGSSYPLTQPPHLPYSTYFGPAPTAFGAPATALTFQIPEGPVIPSQAAPNVMGNERRYRAGAMGYPAPILGPPYSLSPTFGTSPATSIPGALSPSLPNPYGFFGPLIGPTGVPVQSPGTSGPGVNPGSP